MSVLLDFNIGEVVIDLFTTECPIACENFLKLCKMKYYNNNLIFNVQPNYLFQTGDPSGTGRGGECVEGIIQKNKSLCFVDEIVKSRKINKLGYVCMSHLNDKENSNRSQFFVTLRGDDMGDLNGKFTVLGEVAEGFDVLLKINSLYCDESGRPFQDVRIRHTFILDDPFSTSSFSFSPSEFDKLIPPQSPTGGIPEEEEVKARIEYSENNDCLSEEFRGKTKEEIELILKEKEAYSSALVLEMIGDIPDAEVAPPKEVLFVCKLNQVTTDSDLELIFSRFGKIKECQIIRDYKTGDSLNYAFIEFETEEACIEAYEKMNNVLIDDRRIKVDFSQSVSKLWNKYLMRPKKDVKKNSVFQKQENSKNAVPDYNRNKYNQKDSSFSRYAPSSSRDETRKTDRNDKNVNENKFRDPEDRRKYGNDNINNNEKRNRSRSRSREKKRDRRERY